MLQLTTVCTLFMAFLSLSLPPLSSVKPNLPLPPWAQFCWRFYPVQGVFPPHLSLWVYNKLSSWPRPVKKWSEYWTPIFNRVVTDLFNGQLQQLWQAGCQHPYEEWCRGAANVQHAGGQHGHERVLPGERVEQRQSSVAAPRQDAAVTHKNTV